MVLRQRTRMHMPPFEELEWQCWAEDHKGRLATSSGFLEKIVDTLQANKYKVDVVWATEEEADLVAAREAEVYKPRWDRIDALVKDGFKFRYKQREALEMIASKECGRIDCPPGWGKGTLIGLVGVLLPKAKIDVTTKRVAVMHQRLYPELSMLLPSVGMVGGGRKILGKRVMCITADSLHYARPDSDIVLVDEGHEAGSDSFAEKMGVYDHARVWMFSASWGKRLDNKDMRTEAMAGPIRLKVTYQEAVEHEMVVPITVVWGNVIMDVNPASDTLYDERKSAAYWTNEYRNKLIARDARLYPKDTQVLISVETLEHAMALKRLLPEFKVVYSHRKLKPEEIKWFTKHYPKEFEASQMTDERRRRLTRLYEQGKLKKVIATTVWNVGVNFRHLEVLIRADGGGSPVNDTQIPGRTSRINSAVLKDDGTAEKFVGIVHDYLDQFDKGCSIRSQNRGKSYAENGWTQITPPRNEIVKTLRSIMKWGENV